MKMGSVNAETTDRHYSRFLGKRSLRKWQFHVKKVDWQFTSHDKSGCYATSDLWSARVSRDWFSNHVYLIYQYMVRVICWQGVLLCVVSRYPLIRACPANTEPIDRPFMCLLNVQNVLSCNSACTKSIRIYLPTSQVVLCALVLPVKSDHTILTLGTE